MARVFRFDGFVLDTSAFELRCGSVIVAVEPLVLDLITLLLERPGVVLSRDTLIESVWDGRIVSESTVSTAIKSTRKALGQLAQGNLDDALKAAETACMEDDRIYLPRLALAAIHLVRKDQVNALAAVQECVRTKPDLNQEEITCIIGKKLGISVWAIARYLPECSSYPGPSI